MRRKHHRRFAVLLHVSAWFLWGTAAGAQELTGHWTFDEGHGTMAGDSSGMNHHGDVVNASWVDGLSGKALALRDYSADYPPSPTHTFIRVEHSERLNPQSGFDISATIRIDPAFEPYFDATIVQKGAGYGCAYRVLLTRDFRVKAVAGNDHAVLEGATVLPVGTWTTIRAAYDGENLTIHVDGEEDGSHRTEVNGFSNRDDILMGERFTGDIDEIRISIR